MNESRREPGQTRKDDDVRQGKYGESELRIVITGALPKQPHPTHHEGQNERRQQPPQHDARKPLAGDQSHHAPLWSREENSQREKNERYRCVQRNRDMGENPIKRARAICVSDNRQQRRQEYGEGQRLFECYAGPRGRRDQRRSQQQEAEGRNYGHAARRIWLQSGIAIAN